MDKKKLLFKTKMNGSTNLPIASILFELSKNGVDMDESIQRLSMVNEKLEYLENASSFKGMNLKHKEIYKHLAVRAFMTKADINLKEIVDVANENWGSIEEIEGFPIGVVLTMLIRSISQVNRFVLYLHISEKISKDKHNALLFQMSDFVVELMKMVLPIYKKVDNSSITLFLFCSFVEDIMSESIGDILRAISSSQDIIEIFTDNPMEIIEPVGNQIISQLQSSLIIADSLLRGK